MADRLSDLTIPANRAAISTVLPTLAIARVLRILQDNNVDEADLPADEAGRREALQNLVNNNTPAVQPQSVVAPYYDVYDGDELPEEIIRDWVKEFPTSAQPWDSDERKKELRPFLQPSNFSKEWTNRKGGMCPDISVGPWATYVESSPQGASVVKADKIAMTTQKAIDDCFRPYWDMVLELKRCSDDGEAPTEELLSVAFLLGKTLANTSVFHEQNRIRAALAVLKPGAEELYSQGAKVSLLGDREIATLQQLRDTEKLADKLKVSGAASGQQQRRGRGGRKGGSVRHQQNSRSGQQQTLPAAVQQPSFKGGKGRGRGRGN